MCYPFFMDTLRTTPAWVLPVAIVAAGVIVATALYMVRIHSLVNTTTGDPAAIRPVTPVDHLMGNPSAPVVLIEYGDIDSEYTKKFNSIMEQIMTEYAESGKVAWVFRHFPIISIHPNAAAHASAAECVASIAGPNSFWRFIDAIAAQAPGSNQFSPKDYSTIIAGLNVPSDQFAACVSKGTFESKVQGDFTNATLAGAKGAPYLVLIVKGKPPVTIDGALPYSSMKKILDDAVARSGH